MKRAREDERESCAKIAEGWGSVQFMAAGKVIAREIRKRRA